MHKKKRNLEFGVEQNRIYNYLTPLTPKIPLSDGVWSSSNSMSLFSSMRNVNQCSGQLAE